MGRIDSAVGAEIVVDGRPYVNFGGSSYLGLSGLPEITEAGVAALRQWGAGAPMPANHQATPPVYAEAEGEAARFFGSEAAVLSGGGYVFGLMALTGLRREGEVIFYDELCHFSLRDGIAATGVVAVPYHHLDAEDLKRSLSERLRRGEWPLVVTDGLYSSRGAIAPLAELAEAIAPYEGRLLVDESHSFGVLGATGRGALEQHGLAPDRVVRGGSLGKAFGVSAGVIPATDGEAASLRSTGVGRGATPGIPAAAAMAAASLRHVREHPDRLERLRRNTAQLKAGLNGLGLAAGDSIAPIASFSLGSEAANLALKARLLEAGIFVYRTTYIGAAPGGLIRCAAYADHRAEHIDRLVETLRSLI